MTTTAQPSPLAVAALAFVRDGVAASDLESRFKAVDAAIDPVTAAGLLDELCDLGLARAIRASGSDTRYRTTPLGERLLVASFAGRREHIDLLSELEQMRSDLMSTIAHELRTPLTAVRTSVGLLLDPSVEATATERLAMLETIDRNASRMQRVVGDILDLARFRAGGVQLQLRRFDAAELARSAIASVTSLAMARGQTIGFEAPTKPIWVFADHRRLEQALVNLLSNAHKYSPDGASIEVSITAPGESVVWTVVDHGHGIKAPDKARLFERFFVAQRDRSEATASLGLGLSITLAIVQAHDGRIDVHSRAGRGSTFSIVVPATGPHEHHE
jgi:signal transduction histidine kinase